MLKITNAEELAAYGAMSKAAEVGKLGKPGSQRMEDLPQT